MQIEETSPDTEVRHMYTESSVANSQQEVVLQFGGLGEGLTTTHIKISVYNGMSHTAPVLVGICEVRNKMSGSVHYGVFVI